MLFEETNIVTPGAQVKVGVVEMRTKLFKASEEVPEG
jgi:hypothetical protein